MDDSGFYSESEDARYVIDWCRLFNFYIDKDPKVDLITPRFPPILAAALWRSIDQWDFVSDDASLPESEHAKQQARFVASYFASRMDKDLSSPEKSFEDNMRDLLDRVQNRGRMGLSGSPSEGVMYESSMFRVLHLRMIEGSSRSEKRALSSVLPLPRFLDIAEEKLLYCPFDLRVARLPKFMKDPRVTSIAHRRREQKDVVACLEPSVFLKRQQQVRQVLREDWAFVFNHMRSNVLYYPFDTSSCGDLYYYLNPLLCAFQMKRRYSSLDFKQIEDEFQTAFPAELRNVTDGIHKVLICLCYNATDLVSPPPPDYTKLKISNGHYLQSPSKLGNDCGVVLLDQEETNRVYNVVDNDQVALQLGSYYNCALAARAAFLAIPSDADEKKYGGELTRQYYIALNQIADAEATDLSQEKKIRKKILDYSQKICDYSNYQLREMKGTAREEEAREELERRLKDNGISIYTNRGKPKALRTMANDLSKLKP
jgi:hypothetical protein